MKIEHLALAERLYHTLQRANWKRALGAAVLLTFLASMVFAHEWYDPECCSDQDCAPIPVHAVEQLPDGKYRVTLRPGEHFMVSGKTFVGSPISVRNSMDGDYHACIVNYEMADATLRCLYKPMTLF